jgi:hypothetical protein
MESNMAKKNQAAEVEVIAADQVANLATVLEPVKTINHKYEDLLETHKTKSGIIRFLAAEGHARGPISKFMGIKYQFVRNVLITPLKKTA